MTNLVDTIKKIKQSVCPVAFSQPTQITGQINMNIVGSSFIVSSDGYVCTCAHVVNGRQGQLQIGICQNDNNYVFYVAAIALIDLEKDFALLKIDLTPQKIVIQPVLLGESSKIEEGEDVAFYGFPFGGGSGGGFSGSATKGIVSAIRTSGTKFPIFQLDAMTMEGNSGAPLFNIENGLVSGIVSARFDPLMQGNIPQITVGGRPLGFPTNIGFAIPIDLVKKLIDSKML